MRKMPQSLRKQLSMFPRMKQCNVRNGECQGRIEWHHVWIYAGKQINEPWAIIAMCKYHHRMVDSDPEVKRRAQIISLELATEEDLEEYPRKDWEGIKKRLWQDKK